MHTSPNCGSLVSEGDSYCSHCGAHLQWDFDDGKEYYPEDLPILIPNSFLNYRETSQTYYSLGGDELNFIADSICINDSQKILLKSRISQFMKAPDFNGFYVRKDSEFEVYYFHFIQENEFVKTTHVMTFLQDEDYCSPDKIFYDSSSRHDHEKLTSNPEFKKMIEKIGLEFSLCGGGYTLYLKETYLDVEMTGDININVYFNVNNKHRQYRLDLDNMCLSSDFNEYDIL